MTQTSTVYSVPLKVLLSRVCVCKVEGVDGFSKNEHTHTGLKVE